MIFRIESTDAEYIIVGTNVPFRNDINHHRSEKAFKYQATVWWFGLSVYVIFMHILDQYVVKIDYSKL